MHHLGVNNKPGHFTQKKNQFERLLVTNNYLNNSQYQKISKISIK